LLIIFQKMCDLSDSELSEGRMSPSPYEKFVNVEIKRLNGRVEELMKEKAEILYLYAEYPRLESEKLNAEIAKNRHLNFEFDLLKDKCHQFVNVIRQRQEKDTESHRKVEELKIEILYLKNEIQFLSRKKCLKWYDNFCSNFSVYLAFQLDTFIARFQFNFGGSAVTMFRSEFVGGEENLKLLLELPQVEIKYLTNERSKNRLIARLYDEILSLRNSLMEERNHVSELAIRVIRAESNHKFELDKNLFLLKLIEEKEKEVQRTIIIYNEAVLENAMLRDLGEKFTNLALESILTRHLRYVFLHSDWLP
jgi:hypothetical protein